VEAPEDSIFTISMKLRNPDH